MRRNITSFLCLLLLACQVIVAQSTRTISGIVTDERNEPLPGVAITVPGTSIGVVTDANGKFTLKLDASVKAGSITVSYVGMETQTIPMSKVVPAKAIVMKEDTHVLDDVIVTGYQTISKERATGSFGTVRSKQLEAKLNSNLKNILEGQIAGVVLDKDGNLSIRGIATLSAETAPLIVVDGYPTECSLSDLNPDNIENITVLKDGVAASIYGSRSANGVIIVTTKEGQKGKTRISYRGSFKFESKPDLSYLHMASTSDYIDAELALYELSPNGNNYNIATKSNNQSEVNYLLTQRKIGNLSEAEFNTQIDQLRKNDVLKEMEKYMFRTAFTQTHNVGISGGNDYNRYNLAVNYTKNRSSYINTEDDRLLVDLKNEWNPYKFLTIGVAANINYSRSTAPATAWQTLTDMTSYIKPYHTLKNADGTLTSIRTNSAAMTELYESVSGLKDMSYNPITDAYDDYTNNSSFSARFNAFLRFKIMEGLTAEVGGNWSRGNSTYKAIAEADSYRMRLAFNNGTSLSNPVNHYVPDGDMINETRYTNENWTVRTQVNFNRTFGKHRITALAGNEVRRITYDNNTYQTRLGYNSTAGSFSPINIKDFKSGTYDSDMLGGNTLSYTLNYGSYSIRDNRFVSWYFNGSYEYDNRYLISGSVREDLTNFFGTDPKYRHKPMWSVGGTWKVNNESFFDVSWIDRLNVRVSYGINGNISLSEGPYLILGAGSYSAITGGVANSISSYPNNSLRWEKTETTNFGIDINVLKNRLGFSFDYYQKKSSDLLASDAVDPTTGTSSMKKNVGAIDNKGYEFSIQATPVKTKDFQWDVVYNLSLNKNKVKEYNVSRLYTTYWAWVSPVHATGYPMHGFFGYRFAGLNDKGETQVYNAKGDVVLASVATVDDIVYQGTAVPKTDMSLTNNFTYKNWNLSFMFIAKLGHKYRKDVFHGSNYNSRHFAERWKEAGDEATAIYPVFKSWNMDMFYFPFCDIFVGNASYAKLRDLTLTYNFDNALTNRIGMSNARIYLQARNLFRITASDCDIDPETYENNMGGGMGSSSNTGYTTLPMNPEFYIGLSFSF
ncbi:MAG: SusC/RagA family TonB-linked outer membrane protein [Bacteroides sp.]|nr:SusC/RagA family TonB-linked outer membrane protein [Bacteroides sp.]